MTDTINILGRSSGSICLLEAMVATLAEGDDDVVAKFGIDPQGDLNKVEVVVTVNGIEVPFMSAVEEALKRLTDSYAEHVKAKALELISGTGLGDLRMAIDNAEWEIQRALDKIILEANT